MELVIRVQILNKAFPVLLHTNILWNDMILGVLLPAMSK